MAISFPSNPTTNQTYTYGTQTWVFDGSSWVSSQTIATTGIIVSDTEPTGNFSAGASWLDSTNNSMSIYNGTAWVAGGIAANSVSTSSIQNSAVTSAKLAAGAAIPVQTGQSGKYLTTDGTTASWATINTAPADGSITTAKIANAVTLSNVTLSGNSTIANVTISNAAVFSNTATFNGLVTVTQSAETLATKTSATGVVAHDLSTATTFYHTTPSANFTANFTNVSTTDGRVIVAALVIVQGSTPYVPTAVQIDGTAQTVKWITSTAPTGTASKTDIVSFSFIRTGSAWNVLGQYSNYG